MKKQSLVKGTFVLGLSGIIAKFLGLFFRWPIQMLIGDEGFGYYQMSYPLYMFFIAISSGVPVAISKMVSEKSATKDVEGIIEILRKALLLMIFMGFGFTIILICFSKKIILFLKWDTKSYYSLISISIAPIFISIMSAFRGFFQGLQNMNPTAISQILEQIGRVIVGVGFAYILLPKGIEYSAAGAALGAVAGGILGSIYLFNKYMSIRKDIKIVNVKNDTYIMEKLLHIAIPISLGATVGTVMSLIDSALVPQKLLQAGFASKEATILYGQLTGKAFTLVNVPLTLSMSLCASLMPIIAEAYVLNRNIEVLNKVDMALRFSMVIALPSFAGLYYMALPILNLIFPGQVQGYTILKYLSIAIPFIILSQTSTAILQGIGQYVRPVINLAIGCIGKIVLTMILVSIPYINIYGAVIGTIVGYLISAILNIRLVKKKLDIKINYYDIMIKPAFASVLMIIAVVFIYMYVYNYTISSRIACLVSIFSGILAYGVLIILFGVFNYRYLKSRFFNRR
ncbi:stage V sporulation protein B [Clostridium acetireducens DSM 10703]|jgi:stage V sporulation protein B|uniref:Stage V sporulation protein B n=1 Tax=Clostridium acetireducens DSM 10703 TaxID=1121290 RepID=A0A1E8EZI9_9CLOT|nr:polysaccharide biosynthesis protein [Clostridium acetireducens]OFI06573.1 stage V sporulation protein B [Clostridium acetireducens DSM 10703]